MTDPSRLRPFVVELLGEAAQTVRRDFGRTGPLRFKSGTQAITSTDLEVERRLRSRILGRFPDHAVVGEEEGRTGAEDAAWVWHLDPVDGTLNYSLGIPAFCTSVGVLHRETPAVGGVIDPLRGEVFTAARGEGAWLDDARMRVSERRELREAVVSHQSSRHGRFVRDARILSAISTRPMKVRRLGSIALELAYVAAGRMDLLLASKKVTQNLYDVAAGILLVEEAGGRISDGEGGPFGEHSRELVASNGHLHEQALGLVR